MKLSWIDIVLILLGVFIAIQIMLAIIGGSWQIESLIIALIIFNLGLTWNIAMKLEKHISWHKAKDKK